MHCNAIHILISRISHNQDDEGEVVEVELPALAVRGAAKLPFLPPRPLHHVLLDATFPISLNSLWTYLLSGSSDELASFHRTLGDLDVTLTPWRKRPDNRRTRTIRFTTPLNKPLGPKQALNREEMVVEFISANAFVLRTTADSKGVPFASAFENHVLWVAHEQGAAITRLTITGECIFTTPVWGPLRGTINKESIRGMQRAYKTLETILGDTFGILSSLTPDSGYTTSTTSGKATTSLTSVAGDKTSLSDDQAGALFPGQPQFNPAMLIVVIAMIVLMWRMAMLNSVTMHILKKATTGG